MRPVVWPKSSTLPMTTQVEKLGALPMPLIRFVSVAKINWKPADLIRCLYAWNYPLHWDAGA